MELAATMQIIEIYLSKVDKNLSFKRGNEDTYVHLDLYLDMFLPQKISSFLRMRHEFTSEQYECNSDEFTVFGNSSSYL